MPNVSMPKLSDTMTEGTLVKWVKENGDHVEPGDVIAEVETDKATMEMEAFDEGTLTIYAAPGTVVPVGTAIAFVAADGETAPPSPETSAAAAPAAAAEASPAPAPTEAPAPTPEPPAATTATAPAPPSGAVPRTSPLAAKLAAEHGLDLARIAGSGPGGRIIKRDILAAVASGQPAAAAASPALTPAQATAPAQALAARNSTSAPPLPAPDAAAAATGGAKRIELGGMRTIIAERLVQSKTTIPHFYLNLEMDAAPLLALRKQVNDAAAAAAPANPEDAPNKYTINDFILKAVVAAVSAVPEVNASFAGDHLLQYDSIGLSVAVALDDNQGLVTPVIPAAETKSLLQLSLAMKDLAGRARSKRLSPNEFQGGTITVSSLGGAGIDQFDAIINPPQAIILSIGAIKKKPVIGPDDEIVPGQRMWIGMSCDHRVVDGALGAAYLNELRKLIENPALMLV